MALMLVSMMVNFIHMFRIILIPWFFLTCCVGVGYYWRRDVVREGAFLRSHSSIISGSIITSILLFIFSEVIFFSGFFCAIFYSMYSGEINDVNFINISLLDPLRIPFLNTVLLLSSGLLCTLVHEELIFSFIQHVWFKMGIWLGLTFF